MNTKEFGQITESKFVFECSKLNVKVSRPIGDTTPYDFIIDVNNTLYKVQCKTLRKVLNGYSAQTHKKVGNRRKEKASYEGLVDLFFLYNPEDDVFVYVSIKNVTKTNTIFKIKSRTKNSRLIEDYQDLFKIIAG